MSPSTTLFSGSVSRIQFAGQDAALEWYDGLVEARVDLQLRLPGRATLRFNDPGYALVTRSQTKLGTEVMIGAQRSEDADVDVLLKGEVTGISVEQNLRDDPELVLVVHDKAHRLTRGTTVKALQQMSGSQLVQQIASNHGLRAMVSGADVMFDYFLQTDSDFALIDQIAHRTGCDWWVDDSTLHFMPAASNSRASTSVALTLGQNLSSFSVRASGVHRPDSVSVAGWDLTNNQKVSATASSSGVAPKPDAVMFSDYFSPGSRLGGSKVLRTSGSSVQSAEEATKLADAIRDQALAGAVTATGTALEATTLLPGVTVTVADAGPTTGTYHLTKVEHVYRHTFESHFTAGDRVPTSLVDVVGGGAGGAGVMTHSLRHSGLVVGIISNNRDPEGRGRVKVSFPTMDSPTESTWARVLTIGAGDARGMVAPPEVDDEVLVGFEGDDPRHPVVLGGLYTSKAKPHKWDVDGSGKVLGRRISSRLGHYIELEDGDQPAQQYVLIALAGEKHKVTLAKDRAEIELPDSVPFTLKVGSQAEVKIDGSGNLTIKAATIKMEATGSMELKAPSTKVDASGSLELHGVSTQLKADGTLQVQSSGPATIKGNPVAIN